MWFMQARIHPLKKEHGYRNRNGSEQVSLRKRSLDNLKELRLEKRLVVE